MDSDAPNFFLETSPGEDGTQDAHSPSEGSSEMDTATFDTSIRHFVYADSPINASNSVAPVAGSTNLPMRMKPGNKKSFVWNYFRHPENEAGIVDRTRTQCLLCKSQLAFNASGTTTTMLNHLKSRHGEIAQREESQRVRSTTSSRRKEAAAASRGPTSSSTSSSYIRHSPSSQALLTPPIQSQNHSARMRQSNGCSDDFRKFSVC